MKSSKIIILTILVSVLTLMVGCTGRADSSSESSRTDKGIHRIAQASDIRYTRQAAMHIYAYQPVKALQILDTAVMLGNLSDFEADISRTRIYSSTVMIDQLDTMLNGPKGICFDTARAIGERLLEHDSVKANLKRQLNVLESLANAARRQDDMARWLQRSRQYVDVCHQLGTDQKTNAMRAEADIGAALYSMGQEEQGKAMLDSVIDRLSEMPSLKFNELDVLVVALKRKINILASEDKYEETLPLSYRIIELLDDFEQHPDNFHDGSYREPKDTNQRADYIEFYRNKAQNLITAAYASMGEHGNMIEAFNRIERSVRKAMAREHTAQYHALEMQMEDESQQAKAKRAQLITAFVCVFALLVIVFAIFVIFKNRAIRNKNRFLVQQITDTVKYKKMYWEEMRKREQEKEEIRRRVQEQEQESTVPIDLNKLTDKQLFQYVHETILRERLYLDSTFGRQTLIDRFHLSKERVGSIFSKGSEYAKITNYIQIQRMEYAAKLLIVQPDKNIKQVSIECGFSNPTYFSNCFRQHFGISPTDFRQDMLHQEADDALQS